MFEFPATALDIGTARLMLELKEQPAHWQPAMGERVLLELLLPVGAESVQGRSINFRAKVAAAVETPTGGLRLELTFRKPSFKYREYQSLAVQKTVGNGWAM